MRYETAHLTTTTTEPAPDGSEVRPLLALPGASMAHFELAPGQISRAVRHRTLDELWYIIAGRGEMWRRQPLASGEVTSVERIDPGTCVSLPAGTAFQFSAEGSEALRAIAVTLPPWSSIDATTEVVVDAGNPDWSVNLR